MKQWFQEFVYKLSRIMYGRYGYDALGKFLIIVYCILIVCSYIPAIRFLSVLAMPILIWCFYRAFSKNIYARQRELDVYLRTVNKIKKKFKLYKQIWRERKTRRYFKCKNCKAILFVPKHKGKIEITCPKCKNKIIKKT